LGRGRLVSLGPRSPLEPRARPVLRFKGEPHRLIFAHAVLFPEPFEQIKAEVAAQGLLDDFAVALTLSCGADLYPAEHVSVESDGSTHLVHIRILASWC
jgi:hypothetical protein